MQTNFYNAIARSPKHADDPAAVAVSVSVWPDHAVVNITTMLTIAAAREFALKIARAADEAEAKLPK